MRLLLDVVAKGVSILRTSKEPLIVQSIDGSNSVSQVTSLIQVWFIEPAKNEANLFFVAMHGSFLQNF